MKTIRLLALFCTLSYGTAAQKLPISPGHILLITSVKTGDTEVFATDPVNGTSVNITNAPLSEERYPAWSPNGRRIVFIHTKGNILREEIV